LKRRDLVRHIEAHGCELLREGAHHSVYVNRSARKTSTVPRHRDINEFLALKAPPSLEVVGGVALAEIARRDGRIPRVSHGR